jgi:curved DNA-binding protein
VKFKDYYDVLGVERTASDADIKKAFRRLARKYHPDVSKERDAELRMKEVNEAYAVLSDPEKRAAYDQVGRGFRPGDEFTPPPDWGMHFETGGRGPAGFEHGDFGEFFEELFNRLGVQSRRRQPARGDDHHATILIDVEDAFHGATRNVTLHVPGVDAHGHPTATERTLKVAIPRGIREGQSIRLMGQGARGHTDGAAGDLYLAVRFHPHPRYRVEGRDIYQTFPIAPWEAALGAHVEAETPDGPVKIRIPAGSQSGQRLRLKGRGMPDDPAGDLYLELQIVVPPADTPKARQVYEAMARDLKFDPRGRVRH